MRMLPIHGRRSGDHRDCRCVPCATCRSSALFEWATLHSRRGPLKMRLEPGSRRPAFDRHIDIRWIDVEPTESSPGPLGCQECRSGAQEEVENEIAAPRYVLNRIGHQ